MLFLVLHRLEGLTQKFCLKYVWIKQRKTYTNWCLPFFLAFFPYYCRVRLYPTCILWCWFGCLSNRAPRLYPVLSTSYIRLYFAPQLLAPLLDAFYGICLPHGVSKSAWTFFAQLILYALLVKPITLLQCWQEECDIANVTDAWTSSFTCKLHSIKVCKKKQNNHKMHVYAHCNCCC